MITEDPRVLRPAFGGLLSERGVTPLAGYSNWWGLTLGTTVPSNKELTSDYWTDTLETRGVEVSASDGTIVLQMPGYYLINYAIDAYFIYANTGTSGDVEFAGMICYMKAQYQEVGGSGASDPTAYNGYQDVPGSRVRYDRYLYQDDDGGATPQQFGIYERVKKVSALFSLNVTRRTRLRLVSSLELNEAGVSLSANEQVRLGDGVFSAQRLYGPSDPGRYLGGVKGLVREVRAQNARLPVP